MAELAFKVNADYEEVIRMRNELSRLRGEMIGVNTATAEGKRQMSELEHQYQETNRAFSGMVKQAAENALMLKNGTYGANDAMVEFFNTIRGGEGIMRGLGGDIRAQMEDAKLSIEESRDALNTLLTEMDNQLTDLRRQKNVAIASGDQNSINSLTEEITLLQDDISAKKELMGAIEQLSVETGKEIQGIQEAAANYAQLSNEQQRTGDTSEEMISKLNASYEILLDKLSKFQETSGESIPNAIQGVKQVIDEFRGTASTSAVSIEKLDFANAKLSRSTVDLASNFAKMVLPANAAKMAIAGLRGGLAGLGVAAASFVVKKLIDYYKEFRAEAKKAEEAQKEFNESVVQGAAPTISKFEEMRRKWISLSTEMEKRDFLIENKTALQNLGLAVNGVDEAEQLFIQHTKDYWDAQITRARADAYRQKITEKIKEKLDLEEKADMTQTRRRLVNEDGTAFVGGRDDRSKAHWEEYTTTDSRFLSKKQRREKEQATKDLEKVNSELEKLEQQEVKATSDYQKQMEALNNKGNDKNYLEGAKERKKNWDEAKKAYNAIAANKNATKAERDKAKAELDKAAAEYKSWTGINPDAKTTKNKLGKEKDEREKAIKKYGDAIEKAIASTESDIAKAQISAIENEIKRTLATIDQEDKVVKARIEKMGEEMNALYNGNVDLANRPQVADAIMASSGWIKPEEVRGDYATVFSSSVGISDASGKEHEILVTPILPDGKVLTPDELDEYVDNVLSGAKDIKEADNLGIVIAIDVKEEDGERLHEIQEDYYELVKLQERASKTKKDSFISGLVRDMNKNAFQNALGEPEDDLDEMLTQYGDYEEKRVQIHLKWLGKINAADEEHKELYEKMFKDELFELDSREGGGLEKVFGNVSRYTKEQLAEARRIALDYKAKNPDLSPEKLKAIQDAINAMDEADYERRMNVGNSSIENYVRNQKYMKDLKERIATADAEGNKELAKDLRETLERFEANAGQDKIMTTIGSAMDGFGMIADAISRAADAIDDADLKRVAEIMSSISQSAENAFDTFEKTGSVELSVLTLWKDGMKAFVNAWFQASAQAHKIAEETRAIQRNVNSIQFDRRLDFSTIFGEDRLGRMIEAAKVIREIGSTEARAAAFAEAWGMSLADVERYFGNVDFSLASYGNNTIKIGKDGLFSSSQSYSLNEYARQMGITGDLFARENIGSTLELLKSIRSGYEDLDEESAKWIDNAIVDLSRYDEALNVLKENLSSVFGNMQSQLADATIEGLRSGATMGAYEMKQILGGSVHDLQKQMVEGIYARYLTQYEDQAFSLLVKGGTEEDLVSLYAKMIENMSSTVDVASRAALRFEEVAKENGFDLEEMENAEGSRGSYQNITETTGSAIEGRLSALQISSEVKQQYLGFMSENLNILTQQTLRSVTLAEDIRSIQSDSYLALLAIRDNTAGNFAAVRDIQEKITAIETHTRNL